MLDMFIGTLVNALAIATGALVGVFFNNYIPQRIKTIVFQGLGICSLLIGMQMALKFENVLVVIFSILIGAIIGEAIDLEKYVEKAGDLIKNKLKSKNATFTEGFVTASILFCVGAMAIVGSINDGLRADHTVLFTKSILDGFAAIALASTLGIGVMFSAVSIAIYQGLITIFAFYLQGILSASVIAELTSVGGLLIVGIAFNLLEIKKVKVTNMLPAILIVLVLAYFLG